jgi:hypothetical protein
MVLATLCLLFYRSDDWNEMLDAFCFPLLNIENFTTDMRMHYDRTTM